MCIHVRARVCTHHDVDGPGAVVFLHRVEDLFGRSSAGDEGDEQEEGAQEDHGEQHTRTDYHHLTQAEI